ncbi:MAG: Stp1/IreP family PP2C-type Ser/Thr phosphatase [Gemmatimonadales bacterium]
MNHRNRRQARDSLRAGRQRQCDAREAGGADKPRERRHLASIRVAAPPTASYLPRPLAEYITRSTATPHVRASFFALTDRGRTRDHNEDTFLVADLGSTHPIRESRRQEMQLGERGALYLVADGMGGAAAGEVASEMAATGIYRYLVDTWQSDQQVSEERFVHRLREAVELANLEIHNYAREHPEVRGMGTTATVAGLWRDRLYLAQIGDSRGYLVRDGEARQLTRDQSLTQRLVDVGELTEEEAEASERRNIILQALGPDALVKVDLSWQSLQQGDVVIICSDGLSNLVRREDIAQAINEEHDIAAACRRLVTLANERGGPDNITVIAVRVDGDGLPKTAGEAPGYHELVTSADRPALQPTSAFPATPRPLEVARPPLPARGGSPTGLALAALAIAMGILAIALLLKR